MTSRNKAESIKGIAKSGNKCVICGWAEKNCKGQILVEGAHVCPLEYDPKSDTYDNIIALCPNHHVEFDGYVFAIDPETCKIVCRDSNNPINGISIADNIKHINKRYLAYRMYRFKKENNIE